MMGAPTGSGRNAVVWIATQLLSALIASGLGCGESSETSGSGGAGGGTGGGGGTGQGGEGEAGPTCRTYASAYNFSSSLGASYNFVCWHEETPSAFVQICQQGGSTDIYFWPSRAEFIREAKALGLFTRTTWTRDIGAVYETVFEYDDQGRLDRIVTDGDPIYDFDAWDELGRHVHGRRTDSSCFGAEVTMTYDDEARTVREQVVGSQDCSYWFLTTYDEDQIRTRTDYHDGEAAIYTTLDRETVCKE